MSPEVLLKDPLIVFFKEKAKELGIKLYIVGGIPRDIIMGKGDFKNYDFVTISDPLKLAKEFKKDFNSKIAYYSDFKTVEIEFEDKSIDIAVARKEYYPYPGSLPKVEEAMDINEDLLRRDFTINSIAIEIFPEFGKFYDPFNGEGDIKEKRIRILKEGSFYEDPTRAFRAIRYKNRLDFFYAPETEKEFQNYVKSVKNLKFPRIKKELGLISVEEKRSKMWKEISERKMLYSFDENLNLREDLIEELSEVLPFSKDSWLCFFYLFLRNKPKQIFEHLSNKERRIIDEIRKGETLIRKKENIFELHPFLKRFNEFSLLFLSLRKKDILLYIEKRKNLRKLLSGDEIIKLGIDKKRIEQVKEWIELRQMMGEIKTKEEAIKYLIEKKNELQSSSF